MAKKSWGVFTRTYPGSLTPITSLASAVGSQPARVLWFKQWNGSNFAFTASEFTTVIAAGYTPMLTWQPRYFDNSVNHILSADILAGNYDSLIASYATGINALGVEVWIRLMHEMNGNWDDWMVGQGDYTTAAVYVTTYQYIVNKFRSSVAGGVPNAKFVFCPNHHWGSDTCTYAAAYPGDAYIDIIGTDGYNKGDNPGNGWISFSNLFNPSLIDLVACAPSKPCYIMEMGSVEAMNTNLYSKAAWIEDAIATINADSRLSGFNWWHATGSGVTPPQDFSITTSTASTLAFASAMVTTTSFSPGVNI